MTLKFIQFVFFLAAILVEGALNGSGATVLEYEPSIHPLANPERGFYSPQTLGRMDGLANLRERRITLILLEMDLRAFKESEITPEKLDELRAALATARSAGVKVIFRAAYGFTGRDYRADPKDLARMTGHIRQLGMVLTENADIMETIQAGLLGPWGEWHDSNWGNPPDHEARMAVLLGWLNAIPAPLSVQVRRPFFIRDAFAGKKKDPRLNRVGWHDDAFLSLPDDMGTYEEPGWDRQRELEWCDRQDRAVPFGGETVPTSIQTPIEQVVREMEILHTDFLNIAYHGKTLEHWRHSGYRGESAFDYIEKNLGYRLAAKQLTYSVDKVGRLKFNLTLANSGFAPPKLPRTVSVAVLSDDTAKQTVLKNWDPRQWGPWAGLIQIEGEMDLPKGERTESKAAFAIRFSDPSPRLESDGRYAIRLANENIPFLENGGWNILVDDVGRSR